jgi:NADPH:quinone reductase-like Zn-dependent oxidoreductase
VLVRVCAASVNPYDWHFMTGLPYLSRVQYGLRKPVVDGLGADLAAKVEAVGKNVTRFHEGDEVFGEVNGEDADHPMLDLGSFADFVSVSEQWVALKPPGLTFAEAAAVPLVVITVYSG